MELAELSDPIENSGTRSARELEAVYDIPVTVSAVLGKTTMQVSQLLKLGRGAVVELTAAAQQSCHRLGATSGQNDVYIQAFIGEVALGPGDGERHEIEAVTALHNRDLGPVRPLDGQRRQQQGKQQHASAHGSFLGRYSGGPYHPGGPTGNGMRSTVMVRFVHSRAWSSNSGWIR